MQLAFVITGVCRPGQSVGLDLLRFLSDERHHCVLWIDFKDPVDYAREKARVEAAFPGARVYCAPRAIWGGPSIVGSMLEGIATCLRDFADWTHLIFCSTSDVPLAPKHQILSSLDEMSGFDYCGSRWNHGTTDLLKPLETVPVCSDPTADRSYAWYPIRSDMRLRIETALDQIYTPPAIRSRRLCNEVFERYIVATSESFLLSYLSVHRLTEERLRERHAFFSRFGLYAGRQWCMCSRKLCDILVSEQVDDLFLQWFSDILIPDECFFQTVAQHFLKSEKIEVLWKNFYHNDAGNSSIGPPQLKELSVTRSPHELFVRRSVQQMDFETILRDLSEQR
jgi:hypothetical protein